MTYNGWKNYPTWAVYTHLTSSAELHADAVNAARHGVEVLQELVNDIVGLDGILPLLAADLVGYALAEVDWQALAKALTE